MRSWLMLACLLCCAVPGWALKFRIVGEGNSRILLIYDCHLMEPDKNCALYENGFHIADPNLPYAGDPAVFRRVFKQPGIREVWIISNGGQVDAAIQMARDLRSKGIPVRVPNLKRLGMDATSSFRSRCVSSCTVFFMGGVLRYIDPGATYEVHSASGWQGRVDWHEDAPAEVHTIDPEILGAALYPKECLPKFAQSEQASSRFMALQMLRLFQNTLLIPTHRPFYSEDDDRLKSDAETRMPDSGYHGSREEQHDIHRIEAEGRAAVQDVFMRIEREQMAAAIQWLDGRSDLGFRAGPALDMLRMMYMESIRETSTLSPSELERRGYVTPEVE